jgi:hypothetical protein
MSYYNDMGTEVVREVLERWYATRTFIFTVKDQHNLGNFLAHDYLDRDIELGAIVQHIRVLVPPTLYFKCLQGAGQYVGQECEDRIRARLRRNSSNIRHGVGRVDERIDAYCMSLAQTLAQPYTRRDLEPLSGHLRALRLCEGIGKSYSTDTYGMGLTHYRLDSRTA